MKISAWIAACATGLVVLAGCNGERPEETRISITPPPPGERQPADRFLAALARHCGQSYVGRIVANEPPRDNDPFIDRAVGLHFMGCSDREILMVLEAGDSSDRGWILTRTPKGLRLVHAHAHDNGTESRFAVFGGESIDSGSAERQRFTADAYTIALLEREGIAASIDHEWSLELAPGGRLRYQLMSANDGLLQIDFDLSEPAELPIVAVLTGRGSPGPASAR